MESKLTCGGQEKINEQDSGVEVVHRCLTEGGDSILRALASEATRQVTSFLAS